MSILKWKRIGFSLLSLLSILIMCACGKKQDSSNSDSTTNLEMWTFQEQHGTFFEDAEKTWNKKNPDRKIKLTINVLPYDQLHQKLQVALNSGTGAPDLVDIEMSQFSKMTKGNKVPLEPLNDVLENDLEYLVPSRMQNYTINDQIYGIDYHVGASVVFYNKEILDQAGVDSSEIKTWDDYAKAGEVVLEKTGIPMIGLNTTNAVHYQIMLTQQHSDLMKDGKSDLDTEESIRAFDYMQDLIYEKKIASKANGGFIDQEEFFPVFNNGEVASEFYPIWYMSRMVEYMPDLSGKIEIAPLPVFNESDDRSAGVGGTSTSVTNQSKSKELAKEFVAFAKASKEGSLKTWTILGFDPIRTDVWDSEEVKESNKYTDYFGDNIFDVLNEVKDEIGTLSYTDPNFSIVDDKVSTDVMPNLLEEKNDSASKLLPTVDKTVNNSLE